MDAEEMDVRWYRSDYNKPLLLYRDRKVQSSPQMEQYQNRTTLMPREPTSSGLKQGDVSIRIDHVNLQDTGKYVCYVSSSQHYESEAMYLKVEGEFIWHLSVQVQVYSVVFCVFLGSIWLVS